MEQIKASSLTKGTRFEYTYEGVVYTATALDDAKESDGCVTCKVDGKVDQHFTGAYISGCLLNMVVVELESVTRIL